MDAGSSEQGVVGSTEDDQLEKIVSRLEELAPLIASKSDSEAEARKILGGLGFRDEEIQLPTCKFSGGWRMRIALARALFAKPRLLLLDEPTNHLDIEATLWLEDYLSGAGDEKSAFARAKSTLVVVSHDADFLDAVCTDLIVVVGNKDHASSSSQKPPSGSSSSSAPLPTSSSLEYVRGGYSSYLSRLKTKSKKQTTSSTTFDLTQGAVHFDFAGLENEVGGEDHALGVQSLSFGYEDAVPTDGDAKAADVKSAKFLFTDVTERFDSHCRVALVGPNGCGKTTFVNLLIHLLRPNKGLVEHSAGVRIGYYSQHFSFPDVESSPLFYLMSVLVKSWTDNSSSGASSCSQNVCSDEHESQLKSFDRFPGQSFWKGSKRPNAANPQELEQVILLMKKNGVFHNFPLHENMNLLTTVVTQLRVALGKAGLESKQHLLPLKLLSGGQKARVLFAKLNLQKPHFLVLDEPTNHLDLGSVEGLIEAVAKYRGGVVLVSHDARLVQGLSARHRTVGGGGAGARAGGDDDDSREGSVYLVGNRGIREIRYEKYVAEVLRENARRALEREKEVGRAKEKERLVRERKLAEARARAGGKRGEGGRRKGTTLVA